MGAVNDTGLLDTTLGVVMSAGKSTRFIKSLTVFVIVFITATFVGCGPLASSIDRSRAGNGIQIESFASAASAGVAGGESTTIRSVDVEAQNPSNGTVLSSSASSSQARQAFQSFKDTGTASLSGVGGANRVVLVVDLNALFASTQYTQADLAQYHVHMTQNGAGTTLSAIASARGTDLDQAIRTHLIQVIVGN